jgi:small-conductance mechanosensitive channel
VSDQGQPAKVQQLLDLLSDPAVQGWIKEQQRTKEVPPAGLSNGETPIEYFSGRVSAIRAHFAGLYAAIPLLPSEFGHAAANLGSELADRGPLPIIVLVVAFLAAGFGLEWLFLRASGRLRRLVLSLPLETSAQRLAVAAGRLGLGTAVVAAFGIGSIGILLALDWPPVLRNIVLGYLLAFLALRLGLTLIAFLLAPATHEGLSAERYRMLAMDSVSARFWCGRLGLFIGWFAFGWATVLLLGQLGFDPYARRLMAYLLGLGLLAIGLESAWRRPARIALPEETERREDRHRVLTWFISAYFLILWLLWVASAMPLFWLMVVSVAVPWTTVGARHAVFHLIESTGGPGSAAGTPPLYAICLQRGLRAAIIIAAAFLLAHAWNIDLVALTSNDTMGTRLLRGLLSAVVIALLADLGWQLLKAAIDRKIAQAPTTTDQNSPEWRRHTRLRTLLPIIRNFLFVLLLATAALMGLAALGIEIGPLIAGASVVGVAIGFGAQTLVKDVISGMFYLLDDAFRVGEYIQSGNYKGTVESFSLRSVKLRHHRGPLYTVPFGVLGAVENMSRDWVIDKLSVGVTYDTDLGKVKKLIKQIGKQLKEDPEFGPKILEPLKMQGVEQFGDFAIQIRMKMMTVPNENFVIRRHAYAMIKEAFDANGIKFAFPTVQVASGTESAAAVAAHQSLQKPVAADS